MNLQKQYSINRDYWTLSIGFGAMAGAVVLVLAIRYEIFGFLDRLFHSLPKYPVQAAVYTSGLILVLWTLSVLIYIPLKGLLFSKKIDGVLEKCSPGDSPHNSLAVQVAGKTHRLRYNAEAAHALECSIGQPVRVTVGALRTILCVESPIKNP